MHFVHNHHEGRFSMQETLSTNKILCLIIPTVPQGLYLGVAKFILVVVNVNGGKKLFRSLFAVNELAFWNGWGIKDLVPVVRQVARTGCKEDEENRIHCMSWNTWKLSCLKGAEYVIWNRLVEQNVMKRGHIYSLEESVGCVTTQCAAAYQTKAHT